MSGQFRERLQGMGYWRWIWLYWMATLRLSTYAVCVMSQDKGVIDYHDYHDTEERCPDHFTLLRCRHCGKEFMI